MWKVTEHQTITATILLLFCITQFDMVDALNDTSIEQKIPFRCKKLIYPLVALDFVIPKEWVKKWFDSTTTEDKIKLYYQNINSPEDWQYGDDCITTQLFLSRNITCLFDYVEKHNIATTSYGKKYNMRLAYESPEFNDTISNFTLHDPYALKMSKASRSGYDFSSIDIFHCIDTYRPISTFVGNCEEIRLRWFWPLDAFSFRDMRSMKVNIKHNGKVVVTSERSHENTFKHAQFLDTKEMDLKKETTYQVCLEITYFHHLVKFADGTNVLHDCYDVYTFCSSFLTVDATITLIIILSMVSVVMSVVSAAACYRLRRGLPTEEDEALITPNQQQDSVDQADIALITTHEYYDNRPYVDIDDNPDVYPSGLPI